ncbi:MAG: hypothetical protein Q7T18_05540, partial [Sedimentisphaerales bacterium]|nr:hypothetical protein [Sedimentisphaerales bacterium]
MGVGAALAASKREGLEEMMFVAVSTVPRSDHATRIATSARTPTTPSMATALPDPASAVNPSTAMEFLVPVVAAVVPAVAPAVGATGLA